MGITQTFNQRYQEYLLKAYFSNFIERLLHSFGIGIKTPNTSFSNMAGMDIASTAVDVIVAFILALIAALIGVNLIGPIATAVGGALKNGNLTGAANSLTAQITLIFVTVVILGIVVFLALFGKLAGKQAE